MSTYATQTDVENFIEGWVTDDPFSLERLIQRAERDLDRILIPMRYTSPPTQVISVMGASGGTFALTWKGLNVQTLTEAYNLSASRLQSDLQGLADIGPGKVTILGNNPFTVMWDYQWSLSYPNQFVPVLTADSTNLVPGGAIVNVVEVEARNINPLGDDLTRNQAIRLRNATAAQVEYRNAMGERFFTRAQYESVRGPDFTTTGKMPYIAPKAQRELARSGLIFTSTRAVASYRRYGLGRGAATY